MRVWQAISAEYGFEVTIIQPVDQMIRPEDIQAALRPDTILVSTMYANNETGDLLPIKEINKLGYTGFAQTGKALLFQYGIDKANPVVKTAIVSSCSGIAKPQTEIKDLDAAKTALKITDSDQNGSIAIMKHEMIAYAVGKLGEESGLFRFQLSDDGSWDNPQLLIKGITAMDIHYIYAECPHSENASASGVNTESFDYKTALDSSAEAKSPASIQIVLNNGSIDPSKEQDNKVDIYNINATIRGGNVCADRSL